MITRVIAARRAAVALIVFGAAVSFCSAAEPTRIYLANDDHTDFMWTADADTYADVFVDMLDFHLKLADETATNPAPYRNRFNADGSLWLSTYKRRKTPAEFARLIARIKDGTISVPLNTVVSTYGAQPVEAVLRGMYYAGRIERAHGLRFPLATAMENQTLPLGLASLFAGAGASYSWRGVCACASKLDKKVLSERPHEVYWWTGHDGQRLLLKWYSAGPLNIGTYLEAGASPAGAIKYLETDAGFVRRHVDPVTHEPYRVFGLFGFGGDDLARKTGVTPPPTIPAVPGLQKVVSSAYSDHFHVIAQLETTPARQVIVSNELDYFADFEKTHGATLPAETVTYGNEWDLYSASMSETSARAKRAVEKLRSAELLATLVSLHYPDFMRRHAAARDRAFTDLGLFWEHNWTADGPISRGQRAAWEEEVVTGIESYVNSVQAEAVIRLGGMIPKPDKTNRFFVLNSLGWSRTEAADFPYTGSANIHVREVATGAEVPHQLVKLSGAPHLRILARDVPSAGYKVYEILPGPGTAPIDAAATTFAASDGAITFENSAVKLIVGRDGAICSLIDRCRGNTELAATIDGLALNDLAPDSADGEPLRIENVGPVSVTLRARSEAGLDHTTAITLYRDSDRIDLRNEITANFADVRHWCFSFNLAAPAVRTEEVGAINLDKLTTDGGDYATTHARYDYVTLNHFADITAGDDRHGVTLSNADLAFAKLGHSTVTALDTATPQLNVLAGGQVDGRWLGIQNQNGATYFLQRFALRPHGAYDPVAAMKFALEHQNPLTAAALIGGDSGPFPADTYSLLTVSDPRVLLWAVKPAEEGIDHGIMARLWNVSDAPARAILEFAPGLAAARRTTHIETDLEALSLTSPHALPVTFARQQLQTYRLLPP
jgi:alpha-mannosidase